MKILFTNIQMDHRTGTEIVVRDLALGMCRRGHEVAVYTPHPGAIAAELVDHGVPVVDHVEAVPFRPDVVHGHHHSPTVEALTRFNDTPAIWVCHDRFQYQDIPPRHRGINRYVAVDLNCRERLVEAGIPQNRIQLIHNSVDLNRFQRRCGPSQTIERAAVFSNNAEVGGFMDAVAEGCRQRAIPLDVIGEKANASSDAPERVLGNYDLVFAKARCALEALAMGCAVVLIDHLGMGPTVTTQNMTLLRDWNFGARCLQGFPTQARVLHELESFNPADTTLVTDWIRAVAGLECTIDRYLQLYEEIVNEHLPAIIPSSVQPIELALEYAATLEQRLRALQVPILTVALPPTIGAEIRLRVASEQARVAVGSRFGVDVVVVNGSSETLASVMPLPVQLSYHWICPSDSSLDVFEGLRTALSHALHPGSSSTVRMTVEAPSAPGSYALRVTLVQESVFWFDDLTPPVACWLTFDVVPAADRELPQPTMTLSGLVAGAAPANSLDARVVRDAAFADLGFVDDAGSRMLVFAATAGFVRRAISNPAVACILTTSDLVEMVPTSHGVLAATDPKQVFFQLHNWIAASTNFFADDRTTTVAPSATVHSSASIDSLSVIIGEDCVIGPNVVIHGPAVLGPRTRIDAGAVIGASGFQTSDRSGSYVELRHVGGVNIGEDCHIYSNATIARGVFRASTQIGDRCQIGNNAFVSHQCRLGDRVFVGHNATVNGRVTIASGAWIGPGAVISNEVKIGAGAHVALGSTVMHDVPDNARVSGLPALEQKLMFRHAATVSRKRR